MLSKHLFQTETAHYILNDKSKIGSAGWRHELLPNY